MPPNKKLWLHLLKLIGVGLFVWIIREIDLARLLEEIRKADLTLFTLSFITGFIAIFVKAVRWHIIVKKAGLSPSMWESWKLYNIGFALAVITPAKLGELGRAAYLKKDGMNGITAIGINIIDRLADVVTTLSFILAAIWLLFGFSIFLYALLALVVISILIFVIFKKTILSKAINYFLPFVKHVLTSSLIIKALGITFIYWIAFFTWAILIAQSVGIDIPIITIGAILTIASSIAVLPIAPSGLGTRDAALIALLAPFGIQSEQAVAMALLMFASIVISSLYGAGLWVTSK
ncbi:flippase-like domain-containing protein [Patescibacteria group bacterium]|nr:flippase-like domain-containing protein [Patescibacteria group bacterium]MBU1123654.1 flippase-like domain-containing protein [Patescibacteria group bacterium]MBU1911413.1 flippase-like domain-containing protein [Patescibacteria group bacterium]